MAHVSRGLLMHDNVGQTSGEQIMSKALAVSVRASAMAFLALGAIAYATSASACGTESPIHSASWQNEQGAGGLLHLASEDNPGDHGIVGMWSFNMTASSGGYTDYGYQQWHSDGTEFMNSGTRAPATQNFCMGVWRQVGPSRYHLNHFALSYDNSGIPNARVNIKEDVTLDRSGTTYTGTFTIDVYNPSGTAKVAPTTSGQVIAHRVPAN
jgi:hypothetical protein